MELEKYNLKDEERKQIDNILDKAKKRPRKKTYTTKWLYDYLDESFKSFSYNKFDDVLDMIESLFKFGKFAKVSNKRLKDDIIYHLVDERFLEDWEEDIENIEKVLIHFGFSKKQIKDLRNKIEKEYEYD